VLTVHNTLHKCDNTQQDGLSLKFITDDKICSVLKMNVLNAFLHSNVLSSSFPLLKKMPSVYHICRPA